MVRETRHLWVGNLPHNIREERILEHFKRYGKVQSVKILPKKDDDSGVCATVAFIDIKSAAKAHNADNKIEERTLKTDYYEPPASSTATSAIFIHERDDSLVRTASTPYSASRPSRYPHGLPEDRTYERAGHYYDRVTDRDSYLRRSIGMGYHDDDNYQGRGKSRDRYARVQPAGGNYPDGADRTQTHFRSHNTRQHFEQQRYPPGEQYNDEREATATSGNRITRRQNTTSSTISSTVTSPPHSRSGSRQRRIKRRSPSCSPCGSRSNSRSRSRSRSRSHSSSGSRSSSSSSKPRSSSSDNSSGSRSPSKSRSPAQSSGKGVRQDRPASTITTPPPPVPYLPSAVATPVINCTSASSQGSNQSQGCTPASTDNGCEKDEKRPLGICVRNLPVRSTDTSLKDGLFHEYKKHGKVTMVKVVGQGTDRYAVVCFKKPEDVEKALEVSKDKLFFGCKIEVTAHEGLDGEDNDFRPLEAELDEYHPKATRTLFIGNLEKDITTAELRKHFEQFGEIIEIDIKKQGSATSYAFIQYSDIVSVVKAMRKLDGENLGANRIKLGFGKSMPTSCVWLDGIVDTISEKFLLRHFSRFGPAKCIIDREKGHSLVFYESVEFAQIAVSEMRGRTLGGKRLQVDFASRECQAAFYDKLEMTGQMVPSDRPWERRERREFDVLRDDRFNREGRVAFENRAYTRYESQTRAGRANFRGIQRGTFTARGRGQGFNGRYEVYHDEFGDRRHRAYDEEYSQGSGTSFEDSYEQELREYGYSQRERREYASDEHSVRGRSYSPLRRRDTNSMSPPPPKERHREERSNSPHARTERSASSRGEKHDEYQRERYGSREDSAEDTAYENKGERVKHLETGERLSRRRTKLRNSTSDQESHHSQSPPHSRNHSRSTSPPPKDRKSQKERSHHGKSPNSHSSSQVSSPVRDIVGNLDVNDSCVDHIDFQQHKLGDDKADLKECTSSNLSLMCAKLDISNECIEKNQKNKFECFRRKLQEGLAFEELVEMCEPLTQVERKNRLLMTALSGMNISRDPSLSTVALKQDNEKCHLKIKSLVINRSCVKRAKQEASLDMEEDRINEDCKSDTESGELLDELYVEKTHISESGNSDLKYLQKDKVHWLHILKQLQEGNVSSSDTEGSTDSEKQAHKKLRAALNSEFLSFACESSKLGTKDESLASVKSIKEQCLRLAAQKSDLLENESSDISPLQKSVNMDLVLRKHLDPRKPLEQQNASAFCHSAHRLKRLSLDKERCHSESDPLLSDVPELSHLRHSELLWRKKCSSVGESISAGEEINSSDVSLGIQILKTKDDDQSMEEVSSSSDNIANLKSLRALQSVVENPKTLPQPLSEAFSCNEIKKERELSPLSLPLPKFAASLRSPKSSPNSSVSPKGIAMSPRAGHSPGALLIGKSQPPLNQLSLDIKVEKPDLVIPNDKLANIVDASELSQIALLCDSKQLPDQQAEILTYQQSPAQFAKLQEVIPITSSDSECSPTASPNRPSIEERIRALDEKFNAWSGSARTPTSNTLPNELSPALAPEFQKCTKKRPRFNFLSSEFGTQPSEIVKSLLAKSTIFDQDSKRLEHINEKYEPKEIKLDVPPKAKPFFRTKAAAKEFSTPITTSLQTLPQIAVGKYSSPSVLNTKASLDTSPPAISHIITSSGSTNVSSAIQSPISSEFVLPPTHSSPPHLDAYLSTPVTSDSSKILVDFNAIQPTAGIACAGITMSKSSEPRIQSIKKEMYQPVLTLNKLSSSFPDLFTAPVLTNSSLAPSNKREVQHTKEPVLLQNIKKENKDKDHYPKKEPLLNIKECPSKKENPTGGSKEQGSRRDSFSKEAHIKLEKAFHKDIQIKKEPMSPKKESSKNDVQDINIPTISESVSILTQTGAIKRRVSSIDSSESDSGKSSKSMDSNRESQDGCSQRIEIKQEVKAVEPDFKRQKTNGGHGKICDKTLEVSLTSVMPGNKKSEKKDKQFKNEKLKSSSSKSMSSFSDREESFSKNESSKSSETKEKVKSDNFKHEKKQKNRDMKEGSKSEHKGKFKESSKESTKGQGNGKSRKESTSHKSDKEKQKSERRASGGEKSKQESSPGKNSKSKGGGELCHFLDDEPVYFSMYDKVKARSSQNQSLKDQAKDLESVRQKFNQLKQSRAKREEKSKSLDQESDKESDSASRRSSESDTRSKPCKNKQTKKRKLIIESSSDEDTLQKSSMRNIRKDLKGDLSSDIGSDSDMDQLASLRLLSSTHLARNKGKKIEVESASSESEEPYSNYSSAGRKKSQNKSSQEKSTKQKIIKSDNESCDKEIPVKAPNKSKDHKKKKPKKEKSSDIISDVENSENEVHKNKKEESKPFKHKAQKEIELHDLSIILNDDIDQSMSCKEEMQSIKIKEELKSDVLHSSDGKHKQSTKKKKKSKKASKNSKDKKSSEKASSSLKHAEEECEMKDLSPAILSPKPNSPPSEKPSSPPCLQAGILSDNDFKSDFSDFEFDNKRSHDVNLGGDLWRQLGSKMHSDMDISTMNTSGCTDITFSPSKEHSDITRSEAEPDPESSLPSFLDKLCEEAGMGCNNSPIQSSSDNLEKSENSLASFNLLAKESDYLLDDNLFSSEQGLRNELKMQSDIKIETTNCEEQIKDEKRKKKNKKQSKEKRRKSKDEPIIDPFPISEPPNMQQPSEPPSLVFENLQLTNDDSRFSEELRLDEEIAQEARRLEQELLAVSEETSTFGDEGPVKREEKQQPERRFEEEAAKETRRLEEELFSTARESWHLKEKSFDETSHSENVLCDMEIKHEDEVAALSLKNENIYASLDVNPTGDIVSLPESQDFGQDDANSFKLDDKEGAYDMDNQRKIEDDLAVSALLQEMNNEEIIAPDLTKETDYLDPLLEHHPEDTINYLLPDESQNSLHIDESNPEMPLEETQDSKSQIQEVEDFPSADTCAAAVANLCEEIPSKPYTVQDIKADHSIHSESTSSTEEIESQSETADVITNTSERKEIEVPCPDIVEKSTLQIDTSNNATVKTEGRKCRRKKRKERGLKLMSKDSTSYEEPEEDDDFTDQTDNQLSHFEDITNDTQDSTKDDDNPPVLHPVSAEIENIPSPPECITSISQPVSPVRDCKISIPKFDENDQAEPNNPPTTPYAKTVCEMPLVPNTLDAEFDNKEENVFMKTEQIEPVNQDVDDSQDTDTELPPISELPTELNHSDHEVTNEEPPTVEAVTDVESTTTKEEEPQTVKPDLVEPDLSHEDDTNQEEFEKLDKLVVVEEDLHLQTEPEEKKRPDRPRRGRRPKTRKYSESSLSLPRYETTAVDLPQVVTPPRTVNKRGCRTPTEKVRRTLRSDAAAEQLVEKKEIEAVKSDVEETSAAHDKIDFTHSSNSATSPRVSEFQPLVELPPKGSLVIDEEICKATTNISDTEKNEPNSVAVDELQLPEVKLEESFGEQIKLDEPKRKRGRKKRGGAGEHHFSYVMANPPVPLLVSPSQPSLSVISGDKSEVKSDDVEHKEYHRPKESRLWLPVSEKLSDQKPKESAKDNAYDVFEFRDSEDEEITFERDLQSSVKERLLDNSRTTIHVQEPKHHETKTTEITPEKEKKVEDSKHKNYHHEEKETAGKEYVTELSQHGKISITIRLHQKDGHDGLSGSTAEVVKTSEALAVEEPKTESFSRSEKTTSVKSEEPWTDSTYSGPSKSTRKSTRLMNQAGKTTVDEVIEDVVKGNFKGVNSVNTAEVPPVRTTRRTRASRRSEEGLSKQSDDSLAESQSDQDKNKNEPMFIILDNTVKDVPDVKKNLHSVSTEPPQTAHEASSNSSEPESAKNETKMSLRSYRITRSAARLEASREMLSSGSSHTRDTSSETSKSDSVSSTPKEINLGKTSQSSIQDGNTRTHLPVLKVELPRMTLPSLRESVSAQSISSKTQEDNEEDSDSRSSPAVLIDPVTGFLTPVNKSGEPTVLTEESGSSRTQIICANTSSKEALSKLTVDNANEPDVKVSLATTAVSNTSKDTIASSNSQNRNLPSTDTLGPMWKRIPSLDVSSSTSNTSAAATTTTTTTTNATISDSALSSHAVAPNSCIASGIGLSKSLASKTPSSDAKLSPSRKDIMSPKISSDMSSSSSDSKTSVVTPVSHLSTPSTCALPAAVITTTISNSSTATVASHEQPTVCKAVSPVGQPLVPIGQPMPGWPHGSPPFQSFGSLTTQCSVTSSQVSKVARPPTTVITSLPNTQLPSVQMSTSTVVTASSLSLDSHSKISGPHKPIVLPIGMPAVPIAVTSHLETTITHSTTTVTQTTAHSESTLVATTASGSHHGRQDMSVVTGISTRSNTSWSITKPLSSSGSRIVSNTSETSVHHQHAQPPPSSAGSAHSSIKTEPRIAVTTTTTTASSKINPQQSKQSHSFLHQVGFPVPAYEASVHPSSHSLSSSTSSSGGVIAELLQNPHLLQQRKDYLAAAAVAAAATGNNQLSSQLVRSSTPSSVHPDIASRLGNPTPPHTPTPPVTPTTLSLQPPSEIHAAHVSTGLHLRHPTQPPLIVPPPPSLGIHPSELNAYVHQQMMYAAAHPHYAAIHPELRAQQEAQVRAAAAMSIAPRFAYPPIPPTGTPPGNFRQPIEPRLSHSQTDSKADIKPILESSKTLLEHRSQEEKSGQLVVKGARMKQELDVDIKTVSADIKRSEELDSRPQVLTDSKQIVPPSVSPQVASLRPMTMSYSSSMRQLGPHISVSPHERITDSPVVANLYAQNQLRPPPHHHAGQVDDHKSESRSQLAQAVKSEPSDRDIKPPVAHQNLPTTAPYHSLESLSHSTRQQVMGIPSVGSPAPGYLDGRPTGQPAQSPGALVLRKDSLSSSALTPGMPHQNEPHGAQEVSKKLLHTRTLTHQSAAPSPGPVGISAAHSPLPWPTPIQPSVPSHAMAPPVNEAAVRRGSMHLIPQMGSEVPVHAPPPAHAMSQPTSVPRTQPQTPPHASQVPPQGDSFLLQRYPVMWQGLLALKNDQAAVQMHFVSGNPRIARASLPPMTEGGTPPVRIAQRMRLEQTQLEGVARKMQMVDEHCMLLALPCGRDHMDVLQQSNNLKNGFINYLQMKQAAGIVNAAAPGSQQPAYVIHIFPSCGFSNDNLARIAPDLLHSVSDIAHLLIVIATV